MKVTISVELTESTISDLKEILSHTRDRDITTISQIAAKAIEHGSANMLYRYSRNKQKWQEMKADRELLASLLAEKENREKEGKE